MNYQYSFEFLFTREGKNKKDQSVYSILYFYLMHKPDYPSSIAENFKRLTHIEDGKRMFREMKDGNRENKEYYFQYTKVVHLTYPARVCEHLIEMEKRGLLFSTKKRSGGKPRKYYHVNPEPMFSKYCSSKMIRDNVGEESYAGLKTENIWLLYRIHQEEIHMDYGVLFQMDEDYVRDRDLYKTPLAFEAYLDVKNSLPNDGIKQRYSNPYEDTIWINVLNSFLVNDILMLKYASNYGISSYESILNYFNRIRVLFKVTYDTLKLRGNEVVEGLMEKYIIYDGLTMNDVFNSKIWNRAKEEQWMSLYSAVMVDKKLSNEIEVFISILIGRYLTILNNVNLKKEKDTLKWMFLTIISMDPEHMVSDTIKSKYVEFFKALEFFQDSLVIIKEMDVTVEKKGYDAVLQRINDDIKKHLPYIHIGNVKKAYENYEEYYASSIGNVMLDNIKSNFKKFY